MRLIFTLLLLFECWIVNAQYFEREVFSSAGKEANNGLTGLSQYFMTYNVGEPIIYRGSNSSYTLNNGFIQPVGLIAVSLPATSGLILASGDIAVFPNPFGDYLTLNGPAENEDQVRVQLIDMNGKLILEQEILPHYYKLEIPQHCPPGNYLLNFYTLPGQFIQQTRMIKMNSENNKY
jgi:hypothetical protein